MPVLPSWLRLVLSAIRRCRPCQSGDSGRCRLSKCCVIPARNPTDWCNRSCSKGPLSWAMPLSPAYAAVWSIDNPPGPRTNASRSGASAFLIRRGRRSAPVSNARAGRSRSEGRRDRNAAQSSNVKDAALRISTVNSAPPSRVKPILTLMGQSPGLPSRQLPMISCHRSVQARCSREISCSSGKIMVFIFSAVVIWLTANSGGQSLMSMRPGLAK